MLLTCLRIQRVRLPQYIPTQGSLFWQAFGYFGWGLCWYADIYRDIWRTDRVPQGLSTSMEFPWQETCRAWYARLARWYQISDALDTSCECVSPNIPTSQHSNIIFPTLPHLSQSLVKTWIYDTLRGALQFPMSRWIWWVSLRSATFRYILYRGRWWFTVSEAELWIKVNFPEERY